MDVALAYHIKRDQGRRLSNDLSTCDKGVTRRKVNQYCLLSEKFPTVENLLPNLNDKIQFKECGWTLCIIMKNLGKPKEYYKTLQNVEKDLTS